MEYMLLKGSFVIRYDDLPNQGPEPDGDTIKFQASEASRPFVDALPLISGRKPQINARGINVRLEAIDALETHFSGTHQELEGAHAARDTLLATLGFRDVVFKGNKIKSANADSLPGYVLSNGIDANGRMIGFIFPDGEASLANREDGNTMTLSTRVLDKAVNAKLLADGLVYPAFYGTLPTTLRNHLAKKSRFARAAEKGLWPRATATPDQAAEITGLESLEDLAIWPKLFRRLVLYFQAGHEELGGFLEWLREGGDDRILRLDTNEHARLSDIVTVEGGDRIMLDLQPEDMVVEPAAPARRGARL